MSDPYIIKDSKPRRGKAVIAAWIGGSLVVASLIIGGTAFGLQQLGESEDHGVSADEETTYEGSEDYEGSEGHEDGEQYEDGEDD